MPEVKQGLTNCRFDTAGTSLLYSENIYAAGIALAGAGKIIFGSDFPLLNQSRSRRRMVRSEQPGVAMRS